jgi:hypothetical protein
MLKKKRLLRGINNFRLEHQHHQQNNHCTLSYRNRLISCLLIVGNVPINTNRRCVWSYKKKQARSDLSSQSLLLTPNNLTVDA